MTQTVKIGRPVKKATDKKKGIYVKLPPWLINWMDVQEGTNRALMIEEAMRAHFDISEDTRYEVQLDLCEAIELSYDKRYKRNR